MRQSIRPVLLAGACAASAGAHAALVPEHLRTEPAPGVAFIVACVLMLGIAAALALRPDDALAAQAATLLLAGLIAAYAVSRTTGLPLLHPEPEAVDAVGLATKAVELAGFLLALGLSQPGGRRPSPAQEAPR